MTRFFPWQFHDISLIFSKIPDISLTAVKLPDISRFSRQAVTLTTAEHVVVWSIWAGNHSELCGSGNGSFVRNLASWSMRYWFVLLTEHECMISTLSQCSRCYAPSAVCCMPGCRTIIVPVLRIIFSTVDASKFTTRVEKCTQQP